MLSKAAVLVRAIVLVEALLDNETTALRSDVSAGGILLMQSEGRSHASLLLAEAMIEAGRKTMNPSCRRRLLEACRTAYDGLPVWLPSLSDNAGTFLKA